MFLQDFLFVFKNDKAPILTKMPRVKSLNLLITMFTNLKIGRIKTT